MSELTQETARPIPAQAAGLGRWHYIALCAIILLGGVLRFAWLDRPVLWGDEAATWARSCGTFQDMLTTNRGDGFVPLHYELYWAIGKLWKLDTWRMRLVPAIAGTLMVPAMYFLARQLVRARTALLVALLTATSVFLLNYSRDAKMYMHFWLFATLHVACFLWWLRGAGGVGWWSWVACGVAAVGLHSPGWLVVPVDLLIFLSYRRPQWGWRPAARWGLLVLGLAVMGAGPAVYYGYYNEWNERSGGLAPGVGVGRSGMWGMSGIHWIEMQTRGKTDLQLVRDSASAYLFGYSRAEEETFGGYPDIPEWVLDGAWGALAGTVLVLALGALQWPTRHKALLPADPQWAPWRPALWLAVWLVLPTYGFFYCRSVGYPLAPHHWLISVGKVIGWNALWAVPILVGLILIARSKRWTVYVLAWLMVLAVAGLVGWSIWKRGAEWYLRLMDAGSRPFIAIGLVLLALAMSTAALPAPGRWKRLLGVALVTGLVLGLCEGAWWVWELLRNEAGRAGANWQSVWMPRYLAMVWPAMAIILAVTITRLPSRFLQVPVVVAICVINLGQHAAHIYLDNEPRIDLMAHDIVQADGREDLAVFVRDRFQMGSPGMASINDVVGRYYTAFEKGGTYTSFDVFRGNVENIVNINRLYNTNVLAAEIRRSPEVKCIIVWDRLSVSRGEEPEDIARVLGKGWKLTGEWSQETRRHWNWQRLDTLRRLEFARQAP